MDTPLFNRLRQVASRHRLPAMTRDEATELGSFVNQATIEKMVRGAEHDEPSAVEWIDKYTAVCQLQTSLKHCGYGSIGLDATIKLIQKHKLDRLQATVSDIVQTGDNNASALLSRWVADLGSDVRQSVHPTNVPPPADEPTFAPEQAQQAQQAQQRTVPVQRVQPAAAQDANEVQRHATQAQRREYEDRSRANAPREASVSYLPSHSEHREVRDVTPIGNGQREYDQVQAYGSDVAIQFERCPNKDRSSTTINIKCARAKPGGKTRQGCDWAGAITMMMTPHEVQLVLAVLLGFLPSFRAAGHGPANDKWFEVEETSEGYAGAIRFQVAQGKGAQADRRRVNVTPNDAGQVSAIFMRAARDQLMIDGALLLAAVRRTADLYRKSEIAREQRNRGQGVRQAG